jgi:serine/threonine protein kinase
MKKKVGDYEIGEVLGEGSFGVVKKAVHSKTNEIVAIKIIDKEKVKKDSMIENLKKEVSILMVVDHPNIVNLKEVLASKTKIYLVLEHVSGGELWGLISNFLYRKKVKFRRGKREII